MCEVTEETAVSMCHHGLRGLESLDFTFTPVTPHALLHFASKWKLVERERSSILWPLYVV